jgi:hypothetical protein
MDAENLANEKCYIDLVFSDVNLADLVSLKETLKGYLEQTSLNKTFFKDKNNAELCFCQTIDGTLYRGVVQVLYWDYNRHRSKLGKCLYITHAMISPRKGNILDSTLKEILQDERVDSVFIEAILDERLMAKFVEKGWQADGYANNVFIKK